MSLSQVLIVAVCFLAVGLTWMLWARVTQKVRTEEHPVMHAPRANQDPARAAYPG